MPNHFIAVDWGATRRRIFLLSADGTIMDQRRDEIGLQAGTDYVSAVAALRAEARDAPVLLAGMIGSHRGWIEVPHVEAPAGLNAIAAGTANPAAGIWITPGVVLSDPTRPDIMRGEEVELLGALALGQAGDGLVCHPGRHSKWIEVEDKGIERFRTVMTGDLFAALQAHSILSDILVHEPAADAIFLEGVDHGLDMPDLGAELFSSRARVITGRMSPAEAASRISGLLIGADVRIGLGRSRSDVVPLVGRAAQCARYGLALERAGRESLVINGDAAFAAGAHALMSRLGALD